MSVKRMSAVGFLLAAGTAMAVEIDPLTMRWTFGAHEPPAMYRRMGKRSTGGIEGSARWLGDWFAWWDCHAPERMEEFGLNGLHSRFYKGMGWETERTDFPNVQRFAANCHRHGVTALAYVQFSTLYHEFLRLERSDLEDWAQIGPDGSKRLWNNVYFRWMPCITSEAWQGYIEKMLTIALMEGGFDGVMFDNVFVQSCYCSRCERRFSEHLKAISDPLARFGVSDVRGMVQPRPVAKGGFRDVKDPLLQEWRLWRVSVLNGVLKRFRAHIKAVKPDAIVSANAQPFRTLDSAGQFSVEMVSLADSLDLLMMQSDSFPSVSPDGVIVNRVRDLKLASAVGKPIVALCDGNAGQGSLDESVYLRPLIEDLVWGGIPTDRTVMSPVRTPTFIDETRFAVRKAKMAALNAFAKTHRDALTGKSYQPVRILYPADAMMFSLAAHRGITAAEEILLRNHVPFGYVIFRDGVVGEIPSDCEALVVPGQEWLSDGQIAILADFARKGGRLVVTGECGLWDEFGAQRFENPLRRGTKGLANVSWRDTADAVGGELGWKYRVEPPKDGGAALMRDLASVGYRNSFGFDKLPHQVFVEIKRTHEGFAVHLVNYDPTRPVADVRVRLPVGMRCVTVEEPFGSDQAVKALGQDGRLPAFSQYLLMNVECQEMKQK